MAEVRELAADLDTSNFLNPHGRISLFAIFFVLPFHTFSFAGLKLVVIHLPSSNARNLSS
jgi:hypothetical protein